MDKTAKAIRDWMVEHRQTLSTAESCTGGRIAATLTGVSGSSDYYQGGLVVYQNWMKEKYLGVKAETILKNDVVSREVVTEMVTGCLRQFGTDWAICSTGYTETSPNPSKGGVNSQKEKSNRPADGTIWIGYGRAGDVRTCCIHASGNRDENTALAARTAIEKLYEMFF